jgi:hypothetical protein
MFSVYREEASPAVGFRNLGIKTYSARRGRAMGFSNLLKQPRDVEPVASVSNRDYVSPELTQVLAKSGYVNVH